MMSASEPLATSQKAEGDILHLAVCGLTYQLPGTGSYCCASVNGCAVNLMCLNIDLMHLCAKLALTL